MEVRRVLEILVLCSLCFGGKKVSGTSPGRGSVGLTVGLVLAVIVVIVISCAIFWYCRRRRRPKAVYLEEIVVQKPDIPKALAKEDELQGIETNCPIVTPKNIPLEAVVSIMEPEKRDFHHGLRRTEEAATISAKIKAKAKKFPNIRSWFKTKKSRDKERKKRDEKCKRVNSWLEKRRRRKRSMERKMHLTSKSKTPWLWCSTCH
ncbi:uncharacterized protein [Dendropsophus ebraccatus]|uniref:uncharacterized protein isoform X2 n=1 Tax=Dendropsophus ebraccatus TaxID=150705 RepID=UPI0038314988